MDAGFCRIGNERKLTDLAMRTSNDGTWSSTVDPLTGQASIKFTPPSWFTRLDAETQLQVFAILNVAAHRVAPP